MEECGNEIILADAYTHTRVRQAVENLLRHYELFMELDYILDGSNNKDRPIAKKKKDGESFSFFSFKKNDVVDGWAPT